MEFLNQQFQNMQQPRQERSVWEQLGRFRFGFVAGLLVGILFGWFFHGVVSLVVRLGILAILLIPIIIAVWVYFRFKREGSITTDPESGARVFSIGGVPGFFRSPNAEQTAERQREETVVELDESEYDLDAFKKRLEQDL